MIHVEIKICSLEIPSSFARFLQHRVLAETFCGSPLYMAPEIMQLQKYDAKVRFILYIIQEWSIILIHYIFWAENAGRSLECWCHSISTCHWEDSIYRKQSDTGLLISIFLSTQLSKCIMLEFCWWELLFIALIQSVMNFAAAWQH